MIQFLGKEWFVVTLLLLVFFAQIFLGARLFSVAMDEQIHLPAGFVHLEAKEIEFRKSNAPFIGMLAALPSFLFSKPNINIKEPDILSNNFWDFGNKFLFSNNADRLVFFGRMVVALLSVLMAFYVFKWAKELFADKAGIFSLFLFVFIPVVVGHSQFISTDVGLAVFFFISCYYFWRSVKEGRLKHKVLAGVFLGMALGAKFSGVLLAPLFLLFALLTTSDGRGTSDVNKRTFDVKKISQKLRNFAGIILPIFAVGFLILWTIYFFPTDPYFYSDGLRSIYAEDANPNYQIYL